MFRAVRKKWLDFTSSFGSEVKYSITGNGVVHVQSSEILKKIKTQGQLQIFKDIGVKNISVK